MIILCGRLPEFSLEWFAFRIYSTVSRISSNITGNFCTIYNCFLIFESFSWMESAPWVHFRIGFGAKTNTTRKQIDDKEHLQPNFISKLEIKFGYKYSLSSICLRVVLRVVCCVTCCVTCCHQFVYVLFTCCVCLRVWIRLFITLNVINKYFGNIPGRLASTLPKSNRHFGSF